MRGYVLTFRPTTGRGIVVTESGRACPFTTSDHHADLHGGDFIQCQVKPTDAATAHTGWCNVMHVEVLQSGTDRLAAAAAPLARELFRTVQMETLVH
jgi:hypothetical protein